jgi:hypothetical protein
MKRLKILLSLFFLCLVIFIGVSCSKIYPGSGSSKGFLKNDSLKNLVWKDIYINDGINLYKLNNPKISADSIKGETTLISDSREEEKKLLNKKGKRKHNRSIVLFTKYPIHVYASKDSVSPVYSDNKIGIARKEIINEKSMDSDYIALIVVGSILAFLIILVVGSLYLINVALSSSSSSSSGSGSSSGCYIATMVYGDYNAPEVMVLRRFRDDVLAKYAFGLMFIQIYYRYSPLFVERFRHSQKINSFIKVILDRVVRSLS